MKIDWNKAPEDAQFYACGYFRKYVDGGWERKWEDGEWVRSLRAGVEQYEQFRDFEMKPNKKVGGFTKNPK